MKKRNIFYVYPYIYIHIMTEIKQKIVISDTFSKFRFFLFIVIYFLEYRYNLCCYVMLIVVVITTLEN